MIILEYDFIYNIADSNLSDNSSLNELQVLSIKHR